MTEAVGDRDAARRGRLRTLVGGDQLTWRVAIGIALVAVALRLFFWAYTGRVWEDALITVLHSENVGRGWGLTHHHVGEPRTHGFTSPISVLVPLMVDWFHPGWGLIWIRLVSAVAAGGSVLLVFGINRVYPSLRLPLPLIAAVAGYLAIEHHQMLWGVAGMETQMVVLILLAALYAVQAPVGPWWQGLALAACMYARPDYGFLVLILGSVLLVRAVRHRAYPPLFKAAAVAAATYGAWLIFTTLYYGSPIPNTVVAKSLGYQMWTQDGAGLTRHLYVVARRILIDIYAPQGPMFAGHGTGFRSPFFPDQPIGFVPTIAAVSLMIAGAGYAIAWRQRDLLPIYGFAAVYSLYYIFFVPVVFGWYVVPMNAVGALLAFKGLRDLLDRFGPLARMADPHRSQGLWGMAGAYLVMFAVTLAVTIPAERDIQQRIENRIRKPIGLYMAAKHDPALTIAAEPLGYLGYYGGVTVYDFPGLASRPVVAFVRAYPGADMIAMMQALRPDYLLLRPYEYDAAVRRPGGRWLPCGYGLERRFRLSDSDKRGILLVRYNSDTDFLLMRRRAGDVCSGGTAQPRRPGRPAQPI